MRKRISPGGMLYAFSVVFLLMDILFSFASLEIAYYVRFHILAPEILRPTRENYIVLSVMFTALTVYFFGIAGLYRPVPGKSRLDMMFGIVKSIVFSLGILLALSFFYRDYSYSRLITVMGMGFACVLISVERMIIVSVEGALLARGIGTSRLLVVGTGSGFKNIADKMSSNPHKGYHLIGYVEENPGKTLKDIPLLGTIDELEQVLVVQNIDVVVLVLDAAHHADVQDMVDLCDKRNVSCYLSPDTVGMIVGPRNYDDICGVPLIRVKGLRIKGINAFIKRAMDVVLTLIILIMVLPVILVISILIRIDSPGPIFYMQKRVGMDGRIFWMFKYRSMKTEAESGNGPAWSMTEDPRITRLGYYLRKFSIDEVPQLFNVLKGDMSLVGPRPERPYFVEQFEKGVPRYMERHKVKSGMTGWAQANGLRGDTSITERVQYDLYYIENWSIWFDIKIIILTIADIIREIKRK